MSITLLILLPAAGALLLALLPTRSPAQLRHGAVAVSLIGLLWSMGLWIAGTGTARAPRWSEFHAWLPSLGMEYKVQLDGISLLFVLLTGILTPLALAISGCIEHKTRAYVGLVLLLQAMLYGVFTAQNFFLWFVFWELSLIPAFLLIRLWGSQKHPAAAIRFFLMTLTGSLIMLAGFLALFLATGSADFAGLSEMTRAGTLSPRLLETFPVLGDSAPMIVFIAVLLGLAVKIPLFPLHTWLPAAYTEAPTPVTILLTGLLSKMGIYGLLRILVPIFPLQIQTALTPLLWLSVATIVLSAFAALRQTDLKRILAYSSINHLGYCLLGIFAAIGTAGSVDLVREQSAALGGVLLQVFNHGIIAGAIFAFVAFIQLRSGGKCGLHEFGGLRRKAPVLAGLMGIALFASLGLPGLSGFVGEFLIFKGTFALAPQAAAVAVLGLLLTAVFILKIQHHVFNGPLNNADAAFPDLARKECLMVAPAIGLIFLFGVWPQALLDLFSTDLFHLLQHLAWS